MVVEQTRLNEAIESAVSFLRRRLQASAVVLFGSRLTGATHDYSDIDLAVFSPEIEDTTLRERVRLTTALRLAEGLELEPHFFPEWALHDPPRGSFAEHVINTGKRVV